MPSPRIVHMTGDFRVTGGGSGNSYGTGVVMGIHPAHDVTYCATVADATNALAMLRGDLGDSEDRGDGQGWGYWLAVEMLWLGTDLVCVVSLSTSQRTAVIHLSRMPHVPAEFIRTMEDNAIGKVCTNRARAHEKLREIGVVGRSILDLGRVGVHARRLATADVSLAFLCQVFTGRRLPDGVALRLQGWEGVLSEAQIVFMATHTVAVLDIRSALQL